MPKSAPTPSKRPVYVAAFFGLAALGTFAYVQNRPPRFRIRVVSQTVGPQKLYEAADAMGNWRTVSVPGVKIGYEILPAAPTGPPYITIHPMSDDGELETVGVSPLVVPLGYAKPPVHPRLELRQNDQVIATAPLEPLPPSPRHVLGAKPSAVLRAVVHPKRTSLDRPSLVFRARKPIAKGESWSIMLLRTDGFEGPFDDKSLYPGSTESGEIPLPWVKDAREAEIEAIRLRTRTIARDFRIEGLRLVDHNGATALRIPHDFRFVDRANDLELVVPKGETGPPRRTRILDPRTPIAYPHVRSTRGESPKPTLGGSTTCSFARRRRDGRTETYSVDLVSPRPETLNVRAIGLGGGLVAKTPPHGPVVRKPFTAVVRVTLSWDVPVERFHAVLPVEQANPPPP